MKKLIILLLILLIPVLALAQTAEEYNDMGTSKGEKGDYKGALIDYNKAIQLDPKNALAYYNRGLAKLLLGQKDSGCLDLSKAGVLGYSQAYDAIKQVCQ